MAKLFFKYGTMKSGKSMHLLMTAHNYESQGKKVLIYTSRLDDRWGTSKVRSRVGIQKDARIVKHNILEEVANEGNVNCVLVDESQFLSIEDVLSHNI